jgi:hypothetical protein
MGFLELLNLKTSNNILNDTTTPNIKAISGLNTIDNINNLLSLTHLKRACCMRETSNDDEQTINVRIAKDNEYGYENISYNFTNLKNLCKNLPKGVKGSNGDFNGSSINDPNYNENCDNFYKTYCKTIRSFYDKNDIKYINNRGLYKDHILYGEMSGLECGCINSPFYYIDKSQPVDVLKIIDSNCGDSSSYKTKEMHSTLNNYINCGINIGNDIQANDVNINNITITQQCGEKKTNLNDNSNVNLNTNDITTDTDNTYNNTKNITNNNNNTNNTKNITNTTNIDNTYDTNDTNINMNIIWIIVGIVGFILIILVIYYIFSDDNDIINTIGGNNKYINYILDDTNNTGDLYRL